MTITFLCPNGHQLSAPPAMAGKTGKCPRCQTTFTVPAPELDGDSVEVADAGNNADSPAGKSGAGLVTQASAEKPNPAELFVFLCPNGHRLNGPPSLKGKPGKCPHCGSTFQIPSDDEESEPEANEAPTASVSPMSASGEFAFGLNKGSSNKPTKPTPASSGSTGGKIDSGFFSMFKSSGSGKQQAAPETHAVPAAPVAEHASQGSPAQIFRTLWQQRTDDTELEIFLIEGEIFAPDYFSEELSTGDHGVFASKESGGKLSITVIPWESVRRINMQHLKSLPPHLFQ